MLHEGWAVICQAGLWGWIMSTIVFIVKAFPRRNVMNVKAAVVWGVVSAVLFTVWILGMVMA